MNILIPSVVIISKFTSTTAGVSKNILKINVVCEHEMQIRWKISLPLFNLILIFFNKIKEPKKKINRKMNIHDSTI